MSDLTVAKTILEQLGGNKFIVMTGARDFVGSDVMLQFRLPRSKDGANKMRITLMPSDTYKVETFSIRGTSFKVKTTVEDVYNDALQDVFTRITGLYTRLF